VYGAVNPDVGGGGGGAAESGGEGCVSYRILYNRA